MSIVHGTSQEGEERQVKKRFAWRPLLPFRQEKG
jgi:hypothetical protein